MRSISNQRKLVEEEGRKHAVKRGRRGLLHFENMPVLVKILRFFLLAAFIKSIGIRNALDIKATETEIALADLPAGFDNTRILLLTDFHIDGMAGLAEKILQAANEIEYDFCILGGDYSFATGTDNGDSCREMKALAAELTAKSRVFGVLGNHDRYSMAKVLCDCGVEMLVNESVCLERDGDKIYLAGIDDCHYYGSDDIALAGSGIGDGAFKIMVSHTPEKFRNIHRAGYSLQLGGHTHGGQVCLPVGAALVTGATIPRKLVKGLWHYKAMAGYTSRGTGTSGLAVRYFCPPEASIITLKKNHSVEPFGGIF